MLTTRQSPEGPQETLHKSFGSNNQARLSIQFLPLLKMKTIVAILLSMLSVATAQCTGAQFCPSGTYAPTNTAYHVCFASDYVTFYAVDIDPACTGCATPPAVRCWRRAVALRSSAPMVA